ncbi:MAG: DUF3846 domain-containing protein [Oscillibacter sp.]|nr:DUF3846 domain-containing protein [Oscillibacter sp.]
MKKLKLNMTREIQVLIVEPGEPPRPASVKNTEDAFSEIVGGPIACYSAWPASLVLLIANERAEEQELPPNRRIPVHNSAPGGVAVLCGTFLVCAVAGNSYVSLTSGQRDEFSRYFADPGEFMLVEDRDGRSVCCSPGDLTRSAGAWWDRMKDGESMTLTKRGGVKRSVPA